MTKSDCVHDILELNHGGQSVISFSVNTDTVFQQLEHRTPSPDLWLAAAEKVQEAGYEVRLRIDPVIFMQGEPSNLEGRWPGYERTVAQLR